jgi:hypothetical protein
MDTNEIRAKMLGLKHECTYCVLCIRVERMVSVYDTIKRITADITELITLCPEMMKDIAPILQKIIAYQQSGNMSQLADILETGLAELLEQSIFELDEQASVENIDYFEKNKEAIIAGGNANLINELEQVADRDTENEVVVSLAQSGDIAFATLNKKTQKTNYLTGQINPYFDALQYVFYNKTDESIGYVMVGCGMIYEAMAMIRACFGVPVTIIESNVTLLRMVLTYIDLTDQINSGRLCFVTDNYEEVIAGAIRDGSLLSRADTVSDLDDNVRTVINKYRSVVPLSKENLQVLNFNFNKNEENNDLYLTEITDRIKGKEVYLVAGGPSLTPCLPILKNKTEESIILCVGTSAAKLINNGIIPEYVVLIDGLMATKRQMECSFDYSKTEFLYLVTACFESVRMFEGKRYMAYQEGFGLSEKRAKERGLPLFRSGGSVSTFALDVAVSLGAAKVTCLGLDLAYTYDQLHASGIHEGNNVETSDSNLEVKSTNGGLITTSVGLDTYRQWIENYLEKRLEVPTLVNISDGAYIHGMKNLTVDEATNV